MGNRDLERPQSNRKRPHLGMGGFLSVGDECHAAHLEAQHRNDHSLTNQRAITFAFAMLAGNSKWADLKWSIGITTLELRNYDSQIDIINFESPFANPDRSANFPAICESPMLRELICDLPSSIHCLACEFTCKSIQKSIR